MFRIFRRLRKDEDGATAIEYGLVAGIISIVIITTITMAGSMLEAIFISVGSALDDPLQN